MKHGTLSRVSSAFGLVGALTLSAVLGSACGSSGGADAAGGATSSGSGSGGAGGGNISVGSGMFGCEPACVAPQICSKSNVCIDEGTCAIDTDCDVGKVCDMTTKTCVPGGGCGAQEAAIDKVPPNLLVVLDRSCSMTDAVGASNKWKIAVQALTTMTTDYNSQIRFGLTLFPDLVAPSCEQDAIPIPVAPGNEVAIQTLLADALKAANKYFPDGPCVTNIDTAMQQAQTEPALADKTRKNFVLLLTDGKQSAGCAVGDPATLKAIQDLAAVGVSTFVLGFGNGVDVAAMNDFANAGGVPNNGANAYYNAADQASLDAALSAIAQKTLSCTYTLDKVPPDPAAIFVFFNNTAKVSQDATHMSGWDYDAGTNQITFYGSSCDELKSGMITDVDIVFGCDAPTPG